MGSIIVLSRYSSTVVKVVGSNAVPVLATLFLLSYTKLQRTIISAFSFTFIQHEDGTVTPVWLYDGNVPFLKGIHGVLFAASIITFLFVIVPFTLLVLFSPCLQSHPKVDPLVQAINRCLSKSIQGYVQVLDWTNVSNLKHPAFCFCIELTRRPKHKPRDDCHGDALSVNIHMFYR